MQGNAARFERFVPGNVPRSKGVPEASSDGKFAVPRVGEASIARAKGANPKHRFDWYSDLAFLMKRSLNPGVRRPLLRLPAFAIIFLLLGCGKLGRRET